MSKANVEDGYVAIAKCRMCGGHTSTVLLNTRLKKIKPGEEWDARPCDACEERLKTMIYFMGNCGHSGFIKEHVIKDVINNKELVAAVLKKRICSMEKCIPCILGKDIKEFETI